MQITLKMLYTKDVLESFFLFKQKKTSRATQMASTSTSFNDIYDFYDGFIYLVSQISRIAEIFSALDIRNFQLFQMKIGIKSVGLVPQFVNFEAWKVTGSSSLTSAFSIKEDSESCRFWLLLFIFSGKVFLSNLSQRV